MPYYLKWPSDTGTPEGNNKLCQLSGIATTGNVNIALKFAENVVNPATTLAKGAYLYDGRRTLNSTAGGSGGYLLESNNFVEQSGTSNWKLNGVAADQGSWRTALADDVYAFDSGSQADGVISIGARFNQVEHLPLLALRSITITDSAGTHIIDMSASNGSTNTFTSTDGIITLTLFGFTGTSHWVFYSTGSDTALQAAITCTSSLAASLTTQIPLAASISSSSSLSANLTTSIALQTNIATSSSLTANLRAGTTPLSADIQSTSSLTANLSGGAETTTVVPLVGFTYRFANRYGRLPNKGLQTNKGRKTLKGAPVP